MKANILWRFIVPTTNRRPTCLDAYYKYVQMPEISNDIFAGNINK